MRGHVAVGLAIATLAAVPAGAQQGPQTDVAILDGSAQKALDAARAKWKAKGPRSYQMRVRHQCFCPPQYTKPRTVVVRGGRIVKAADEVRDVATVPRLFRIVQRAIDDKVVNLDVRYDAKRGFPVSVFVDRSLMIADEEQGYGADRFKQL